MKIVHVVNSGSKTSVPTRWVSSFQEYDDNHKFTLVDASSLKLKNIIESDVVHCHHPKSAFFSLLLARLLNKSTVFTVHGDRKKFSAANNVFAVLSSLLARRVVLTSHHLMPGYTYLRFLGMNKKLCVIRNGVRVDKNVKCSDLIKLKMKYGLKEHLIMYMPARFVKEKNHIRTLDAFKKYLEKSEKNDAVLLISGGGMIEGKIKKYVCELGIFENVIFTGLIDAPNVHKLISISDLVLVTSTTESAPLVVLESIMLGAKLLLSNIAATRELLDVYGVRDTEINAVICDPYDNSSITKGMFDLENINTVTAQEVIKNIEIESMLKKYLDIYNSTERKVLQ